MMTPGSERAMSEELQHACYKQSLMIDDATEQAMPCMTEDYVHDWISTGVLVACPHTSLLVYKGALLYYMYDRLCTML